jgi:outer membrane biogenesis lipoprotein LolB
MKKIILLSAITTFLLAGCSGNQTKEHDHNDGTHEHNEGETHQHSDTLKHNEQQEFTVGEDTVKTHEHDQNDKDGHKH